MGRSRRRREHGASLVEFALLSPLLFALLLGMFTGGLSLSRKNSMENAAREGARLGATVQESSGWAPAVQARVVQVSGGDLRAEDVCVELIRRVDATTETTRQSSACAAPDAEPSSVDVPIGQCAVKVWVRRSSDLNVLFFNRQLTLDAFAVNRFERSGSPATCGP